MICAPTTKREAVRVAQRSEEAGSAVRTAQFISLPTQRGVCALGGRPPPFAQAPAAQPHQEGVTETWVSVEMGASKTVPPASTREETSSLQVPKVSAGW